MKGQISAEMIIAVIIALSFFLIINVFLVQQQSTLNIIQANSEMKSECENLAGIVSKMYSSGKHIEWTGISDNNVFFFEKGFIRIVNDDNKSVECFTAGKMLDSNATGDIKIYNYDGNVVIGNA